MARLSPLRARHLNVLGRYTFTATQTDGALRPLRDPDMVAWEDEKED